jgi:UDP-GlcNAc:undecaprenyl-phosphate GlcNAc-1-phosphate transferase
MRTYLALFSISFLLSLGLTPIVRRWAVRWGAIDWPDRNRRIHQHPTPRLGGLAIYCAFLLTLFCVPFLGNLVSRNLIEHRLTVGALLLASALIFALGVYDDFRGSSAPLKLLVQVIAASALYVCGLRIVSVSMPWGGSWELPMWLSFLFTAFWIVGITNAFNLIDGIDGLAAGASAFALLPLFICSMMQGHPEVSLLSLTLVGAVLGFLRYNFNPATIFLGDSGSLLLGFMAASLSLVSAQKGTTLVAIAIPLVSFGLPVAEAGLSISRRFLSGDPLFQSDRRHIHHMLLQRGLTQRQAVILLYGICALFSLFGLMLLNPLRNTTALILFVLGVGVMLGVHHLRYVEFHTLGQQIKRGVVRRRRTLAAGIRVRRAGEDFRHAQSIEQLLGVLADWCEAQDFHGITLELEDSWDNGSSVSAMMGRTGWTHRGEAAWVWAWASDEGSFPDVSASPDFWSLRVPLTSDDGTMLGAITCYSNLTSCALDPAQICGVLREDLASALSRLRLRHLHAA